MTKDLTQQEIDNLLVGISTNGDRYVTYKQIPLKTFCEEMSVDTALLYNTRYGYKYKIGDKWIRISQLIPIEIIQGILATPQNQRDSRFNVSINLVIDTVGKRSYPEAWIEPYNYTKFTIKANEYLKDDINKAFYHTFYRPYGLGNSPTQYINILKNWPNKNPVEELIKATNDLKEVLSKDIPLIKERIGVPILTIVLVPRSKAIQEEWFQCLRMAVSEWVNEHQSDGYINGCMFIIREKDSPMTHWGQTGIYPGITNDTCSISNEIEGKDILLIDDIYTHGVNVDEDVLQAIIDNNPKSIAFYSIAKTLNQLRP